MAAAPERTGFESAPSACNTVAVVMALLGGLSAGCSPQAAARSGTVPVVVHHVAGWPTLHRAGATLDAAQAVGPATGEHHLKPARYFVAAELPPFRLFYPVPLEGFHVGPDAEGVFGVTVRSMRLTAPPTLGATAAYALVPSGHVALGDPKNPNERHFAWVATFFVCTLEVTNGEFRRFLQDPDGEGDRRNWTPAGWSWRAAQPSQATAHWDRLHPDYARFGDDALPVVLVTWYEANAYARWLTRRLGGGQWVFRLLTEAEWEKAARGPDSFDYGLGMTLSEREAPLYNWKKNPGAEVTLVGLHGPHARYRPNRYGVYHASGNAAEWTQSVHRPYGRDRPYRDDDRNGDTAAGMRVTRGGSWYSANVVRLHLAYREEFQPNMSSNDLGFRIAAVELPGMSRAGATPATGQ